ncbi:MAG: hypothetical protein K1X55_15295 [Chitinophagales bacterium]|nr:hypothetical protein [Chitinophagales bacterium]
MLNVLVCDILFSSRHENGEIGYNRVVAYRLDLACSSKVVKVSVVIRGQTTNIQMYHNFF